VDFIPFFLEDTVRDIKIKSERKGKRKGERKGERKGINEKAKDMAKKMLNDNLPIDMISKYTDLPRKQIEKLAQQPA